MPLKFSGPRHDVHPNINYSVYITNLELKQQFDPINKFHINYKTQHQSKYYRKSIIEHTQKSQVHQIDNDQLTCH